MLPAPRLSCHSLWRRHELSLEGSSTIDAVHEVEAPACRCGIRSLTRLTGACSSLASSQVRKQPVTLHSASLRRVSAHACTLFASRHTSARALPLLSQSIGHPALLKVCLRGICAMQGAASLQTRPSSLAASSSWRPQSGPAYSTSERPSFCKLPSSCTVLSVTLPATACDSRRA